MLFDRSTQCICYGAMSNWRQKTPGIEACGCNTVSVHNGVKELAYCSVNFGVIETRTVFLTNFSFTIKFDFSCRSELNDLEIGIFVNKFEIMIVCFSSSDSLCVTIKILNQFTESLDGCSNICILSWFAVKFKQFPDAVYRHSSVFIEPPHKQ